MKRILLFILAVIVALAAGAVFAVTQVAAVQDALFARALEGLTGPRTGLLNNDRLDIVLCGTGSPLPSPDRASACTAILAGGHFVIVDIGGGSPPKVGRSGLPQGELEAVLLTHFHSDHIAALGDITLQSWAAGRAEPLEVYGPPGVETIVEGFTQAYLPDNSYRIAHHGADLLPPSGARMTARPVPLPEDENSTTIMEDGDFKITAFRVNHDPVHPAYGYRIDYKDRSVTLSGDTIKMENLVSAARGSDVLIHEALNPAMVTALAQAVENLGRNRLGQILRDTLTYHASPVEAAEQANAAGVELLVYSHLVPVLPNAIAERIFLRGVSDVRPRGVKLGYDGMWLSLPAGSDAIEIKSLL